MWYLDTSATDHFTYQREWLEDSEVLSNQLLVTFGDKGKKPAVDKGTIKIKLSKDHQITIHNVYYVPRLAKHLLSVGQATIDGLTIQFCRDKAILQFQDGNSSIQMVWTLSKRTTSVSSPQSINICINCNCANKETISALNYIFMALLLWSHACFSTSTMSTTKKNERITRNRL